MVIRADIVLAPAQHQLIVSMATGCTLARVQVRPGEFRYQLRGADGLLCAGVRLRSDTIDKLATLRLVSIAPAGDPAVPRAVKLTTAGLQWAARHPLASL